MALVCVRTGMTGLHPQPAVSMHPADGFENRPMGRPARYQCRRRWRQRRATPPGNHQRGSNPPSSSRGGGSRSGWGRWLGAWFVLVGLMRGVSSLRELELLTRGDLECRWVGGGITPDHSILGRFILRHEEELNGPLFESCLLYTSPSPRDRTRSRMPSSSWKKKKKATVTQLTRVND